MVKRRTTQTDGGGVATDVKLMLVDFGKVETAVAAYAENATLASDTRRESGSKLVDAADIFYDEFLTKYCLRSADNEPIIQPAPRNAISEAFKQVGINYVGGARQARQPLTQPLQFFMGWHCGGMPIVGGRQGMVFDTKAKPSVRAALNKLASVAMAAYYFNERPSDAAASEEDGGYGGINGLLDEWRVKRDPEAAKKRDETRAKRELADMFEAVEAPGAVETLVRRRPQVAEDVVFEWMTVNGDEHTDDDIVFEPRSEDDLKHLNMMEGDERLVTIKLEGGVLHIIWTEKASEERETAEEAEEGEDETEA